MKKKLAYVRCDDKGNTLKTGEYHRSDGLYEYKYMSSPTKRKSIYAHTLEELREEEKRVKMGKGSVATIDDIYELWLALIKARVALKTFNNYVWIYKRHIASFFKKRDIRSITPFEVEEFYLYLHKKNHLKINTIRSIHAVLHQIFEVARKKRIILDNATDGATGCLRNIESREKHKKQVVVLSKKQRDDYLDYLLEKYATSSRALIILIMGVTGCRFGEVAGLTSHNLDFVEKTICIDHTISYGYREKNGKKVCGFIISDAKTVAANRIIPFEDPVLLELIRKRIGKNKKVKRVTIDGFKNFIFVKETGMPYTNRNLNDFLKKTVKEYNACEVKLAQQEKRMADVLPDGITCHILRLTAATIMNNKGVQMPDIQRILGHVDLTTTVERYCHPDLERVREVAKYLALGGK